jgi:D-aminopeptidase
MGVRARELGIAVGRGRPGPENAITDVRGVRVGFTTLHRGDGRLVVGEGPVRTGVTVIVPHDGDPWEEPLFAGAHRLNGNGELTGLEWIRESGMLMSLIALTNTHSVGVVRDALVAIDARERTHPDRPFWALPVVGETWDGILNDVNGMHVRPEHVFAAYDAAAGGRVAEGNVGSGTGMICHGFKGGIGTASRILAPAAGGYVVGVLVQANHGRRERLAVNGAPIGASLPAEEIALPSAGASGAGSIIVIVATDAPLLPHQCARVAQRASLGIARTGGTGEHWSGDLLLAFSTANRGMPASELDADAPRTVRLEMLVDAHIDAVFDAAVEATEEAILNALLAADTMRGRDGLTAIAIDPDRLIAVLDRHAARAP